MAVQACVQCGNPAPVGALVCPHCGAEHPHRRRPKRSQALTRRRRTRLAAAGSAVLLLVLVVRFYGVGGGPSEECERYDTARSQLDRQLAIGADVGDAAVVALQAEVERLQAACQASGG
jgi:hypothetical protein